ncbi:winged helix-turn-helix transcriptional regulator [Clostridiaceae bacterium OM08-6BH]|nr:winged helix-turn-helix transcriptional regulator [Clostridiaceae bacterium OM08-6BH]
MKITEKNILKSLLKHSESISITDLSTLMNCDSDTLSYYLESLIAKGLIQTTRRPFSEEIRYSPKRFEDLYYALPIARDYIKMIDRDYLTFLFTAIAALMSALTLIITIVIPLLS